MNDPKDQQITAMQTSINTLNSKIAAFAQSLNEQTMANVELKTQLNLLRQQYAEAMVKLQALERAAAAPKETIGN